MKKRYLKLVKLALKSLRHPRLRHRRWWQVMTRPISDRALWIPCRDTVASGLAIGLFFSMMMMPFQMVPSVLLTMRAKGNIPFACAACWISNPLTMGPLIFTQFAIGDWLRNVAHVPMPHFLAHVTLDVTHVGSLNAASYMLGMLASGVIASLMAYPIVHLFSALMPHHLPVRRRSARRAATAKQAG